MTFILHNLDSHAGSLAPDAFRRDRDGERTEPALQRLDVAIAAHATTALRLAGGGGTITPLDVFRWRQAGDRRYGRLRDAYETDAHWDERDAEGRGMDGSCIRGVCYALLLMAASGLAAMALLSAVRGI